MTKTQLRDSIKREARQQSTNDLDTMIYEIIDDVVSDVFSKERCYELRVIGAGTAMTNATATISLPNDFQHVDEVRFSTDNGVTAPRLFPKNDNSQNTQVGTPKWWQIVGSALYVFPYSGVTTSHKIYLDYFKVPTFAADSDVFPVFRLQSAVKKEVIQRLLEYINSMDRAKAMADSMQMSLVRGKSANLEGRELDSSDTREPSFRTVPPDSK